MHVHFQCPTINCAYAIDSISLNSVQLKVLRRTAKLCTECGNRAKFLEQTSLPNIHIKTLQSDGGAQNEKTINKNHHQISLDRRREREAENWSAR